MDVDEQLDEEETGFETCPMCESYSIEVEGENYSCFGCGMSWTVSSKESE